MDIDRSTWPPGPWDKEGDRDDFTLEYPCIMQRNMTGAWNGYIGLPEDHPWYGKNYTDIPAEVHGGLTYSNRSDNKNEICLNSCHPFDPKTKIWWIGFDCSHGGDMYPLFPTRFGEYRDKYFVKEQIHYLIEQALIATLPPI